MCNPMPTSCFVNKWGRDEDGVSKCAVTECIDDDDLFIEELGWGEARNGGTKCADWAYMCADAIDGKHIKFRCCATCNPELDSGLGPGGEPYASSNPILNSTFANTAVECCKDKNASGIVGPTPSLAAATIPDSCWTDLRLSVGVGGSGLPTTQLSARVDAAAYGLSSNNKESFAALDGLFLPVGRGGELATFVVSESEECATQLKRTIYSTFGGVVDTLKNATVVVTVGGVVAPERNRSSGTNGFHLTVQLPPYEDVCPPNSTGPCDDASSRPIVVRGTALNWACPPRCPLPNELKAKLGGIENKNGNDGNQSSLHPTNTDSLRERLGGITYVKRCSANASQSCGNDDTRRSEGAVPFVTDPRSCLDPARARSAPCAYGGGDACACCPANARCPGGARTWPEPGFWVKSERSTFAYPCKAPEKKRCRGMVHGTMNGSQCGEGYEGYKCGKCQKKFYLAYGACESCTSANATATEVPDFLDAYGPLLWLAFGLFIGFAFVVLVVVMIQRRQGGSLIGGIFRSMDFICYVIILFQTTLYIANESVQKNANVVLSKFEDDKGKPSFIESFFRSMTVFQLDFSLTVRLECLGDDTDWFERMYVALVVLLMLVYAAALLLLPRIRVIRSALLYTPTKVRPQNIFALLYQQFTYRGGVLLVLTHAVSCKMALSNMQCSGDKLEVGADDGDDCTNPAWWILFLVHVIGFPLLIFLGAIFVRKQHLGGTCCRDVEATTTKQNTNSRATGELGLWRYYLGTFSGPGALF